MADSETTPSNDADARDVEMQPQPPRPDLETPARVTQPLPAASLKRKPSAANAEAGPSNALRSAKKPRIERSAKHKKKKKANDWQMPRVSKEIEATKVRLSNLSIFIAF